MDGKIKINPQKTFTKSAYHKKTGISRPTIDKMIADNKLTTLKIQG